jgi:hypothetical protein
MSVSLVWATASMARRELMGIVHERIMMVTPEEQQALQRENLEADEKFWADLHDLHAGTVEDTKGLATKVEHTGHAAVLPSPAMNSSRHIRYLPSRCRRILARRRGTITAIRGG